MNINTKCSLALHTLLSIALFSDQAKITSDLIANSTGSNPVIIRNIFRGLKKADIIEVNRGIGGATLKMSPSEITILKVYNAINEKPLKNLVAIHPNSSPDCPIGCKIDQILEEPYSEISKAVEITMSNYTLADLMARYELV